MVPPALSPITLDSQVFHPSGGVKWLGYWLSPALNTSHHFNRRLGLAKASLSFINPSLPGEVGPAPSWLIALPWASFSPF